MAVCSCALAWFAATDLPTTERRRPMCVRGKPIPALTVARLLTWYATGNCSIRGLARGLVLSRNTVRKYLRAPTNLPTRKAA
jgi:hypothetical protein